MATPAEEMTIDLAAADAEAAKKAKKDDKTAAATAAEPVVIVDPEVAAQKAPADATDPNQGIEKLKKQLKDEQEARQAAEARAAESAKAEAEARGRAQTTELDLVKNAIATVTQANDALESKYAEALAAQDWATASKVQREMGRNSAKLEQLEAGKTRLEREPKPTPRTPVDPVEAFCAQLSGPSANWVRAHPEYVRDPAKNRKMIAAHEIALADGVKADTEDYFRSIEKTLGIGSAATGRNGSAPASEPVDDPSAAAAAVAVGGRQEAPPAAPVSRGANGANGHRPNIVRLSAEEVEIAQNMGMTPEEYARNKMALKKEGKL